MTTLADVRASASKGAFPTERLAGLRTAGAFFCAAFLGRQDVIHLSDAGLNVEAFDTDAPLVAKMEAIYPGQVHVHVADAFAVAANYARIGIKYDVVTVDPWTNMVTQALDVLPTWCALARRLVLVNVTAPWFRERGLEPNEVVFQLWIDRTFPDLSWRIVELRKRSDHVGGVYWAVLEPKS